MANKALYILISVRNNALCKDKKGFPIFALNGINKTKKSIAFNSERTFYNFSAEYPRDIREYNGEFNYSSYFS